MNEAAAKLARVRALKNGRGLQYLVDKASEIFGNPILMHDLDYKALAYTQNIETDDPLWNELVTTGYHGRKTIEMLKEEQLLDLAADSRAITFLVSDELKYKRIFGKIRTADDIIIAAADVLECFKPFDEGDPAAFEALCKKLSKEVGMDEHYQSYGRTFVEKLISQLIDGTIEDRLLYPFHIEILYQKLKQYLFLAVIDTRCCEGEYADRERCKNELWRLCPEFKYAVYSDHVVALISADEPEPDMKKSLRKLSRLLLQNNLSVGISGGFENLYELGKYYAEALDALKRGL